MLENYTTDNFISRIVLLCNIVPAQTIRFPKHEYAEL